MPLCKHPHHGKQLQHFQSRLVGDKAGAGILLYKHRSRRTCLIPPPPTHPPTQHTHPLSPSTEVKSMQSYTHLCFVYVSATSSVLVFCLFCLLGVQICLRPGLLCERRSIGYIPGEFCAHDLHSQALMAETEFVGTRTSKLSARQQLTRKGKRNSK